MNMKKPILLIALSLSILGVMGQSKPPKEKVYYLPYTLSDLQALSNQANKADSALINAHNSIPIFNFAHQILGAIAGNYQKQLMVADSLKGVKKP